MSTTPTPGAQDPSQDPDATREAMRAVLIAQGFAVADVETMLPPAEAVYRIRQAVTEAIEAMRTERPDSEKTWAPYLRFLVDGLPDVYPCLACATGPCLCPAATAGTPRPAPCRPTTSTATASSATSACPTCRRRR